MTIVITFVPCDLELRWMIRRKNWLRMEKRFSGTKVVVKSRKSKKDRQYNSQREVTHMTNNGRQNTTEED